MSDQSMGEGWWEASDGKWYPPHKKAGLPPPPPDSSRDAEDSGLEAMAATKSSGLEDLFRNRVLVFAFIALLVAGLTVLALTQTGKNGSGEEGSGASAEAAEDSWEITFDMTQCAGNGNEVTFTAEVTNHSTTQRFLLTSVTLEEVTRGDQILAQYVPFSFSKFIEPGETRTVSGTEGDDKGRLAVYNLTCKYSVGGEPDEFLLR
jgi:hypothetical protein